jgi:FAD/FMN-containing dehydrogenase
MAQKTTLTAIDNSALEDLRNALKGTAYTKETAEYDEYRKIWNGMIDKYPALIVRCEGTADVITAVKFAREHALPVAIRGGGHNVSGNAVCDDGLVIDLSLMRSVRVDPEQGVVRAEGGAKLGDIDHEAQAFGLAVPVGVVSRTGVGGLSLHGGMGFLTRNYGLTSDNLIGADVVTADGNVLVVNENSNPDLLWALRGGGGNFGVVTSFEFRAHPVGPQVWMGIVFYPAEKATEVMQFFRQFMINAPDEIMAIAVYWNAPLEEPFPEEHRGEPVIVLAACHSGPLEKGEGAIQPFREVDVPLADWSGPMPYLAAQKLFDPEYPDGRRYYWKSIYLNNLDDEVIRTLNDYAARRPSPLSSVDVWSLGGAFGRVKPDETAFSKRNSPFLLGIEANWNDPAADSDNITWARNLYHAAEKFSPGGAYLNFPGFAEEGEELLKKSYDGNFEKLQKIKAKYDPENFFKGNFNIRPVKK